MTKEEIKVVAKILYYLELEQIEEETKRDNAVGSRNYISAGGFEMITVGIITAIKTIKDIYSENRNDIFYELEKMKRRMKNETMD